MALPCFMLSIHSMRLESCPFLWYESPQAGSVQTKSDERSQVIICQGSCGHQGSRGHQGSPYGGFQGIAKVIGDGVGINCSGIESDSGFGSCAWAIEHKQEMTRTIFFTKTKRIFR